MADLKDLIELKTSLDTEEVRELHRLRALNARILNALKGVLEVANVRIDDPRIKVFDSARSVIAEAETQLPTNAAT